MQLPFAWHSCNDCRRRDYQVAWLAKRVTMNTAYKPKILSTRLQNNQVSYNRGGCSDDCIHPETGAPQSSYVENGVCNDAGPDTFTGAGVGSSSVSCAIGTDCTDCGPRTSARSILVEYACDDSCGGNRAGDGICQDRLFWTNQKETAAHLSRDGQVREVYPSTCKFGTDCSDCGAKNSPVLTTPYHMGGALSSCISPVDETSQVNNHLCQDGGHGSTQEAHAADGTVSFVGAFFCEYGTECARAL